MALSSLFRVVFLVSRCLPCFALSSLFGSFGVVFHVRFLLPVTFQGFSLVRTCWSSFWCADGASVALTCVVDVWRVSCRGGVCGIAQMSVACRSYRDGPQADEWDSYQLEVVDFARLVYFRQGQGD